MILRAKTSLYSKSTQKAIFGLRKHVFWIQRPQEREGPHENIFKRLIYPFFPKNGPGGGGLQDFTRRGTNYLHTTLLKPYPERTSLDSQSMFFGFSVPKIRGGLTKTFSKGSFTRFFAKIAPGGGAFYQISADVALTTCIQLYSKRTQKAIFWTPKACSLDSGSSST